LPISEKNNLFWLKNWLTFGQKSSNVEIREIQHISKISNFWQKMSLSLSLSLSLSNFFNCFLPLPLFSQNHAHFCVWMFSPRTTSVRFAHFGGTKFLQLFQSQFCFLILKNTFRRLYLLIKKYLILINIITRIIIAPIYHNWL